MKHIKNILFLICILAITSCVTDDQCHKDKYVKMQVGIYHVTYNGTTKTASSAYMNIDSITVKGIGVDSILYNKTKTIHSLTLPLNKFTGESKYEIIFNQTIDTVTITHKNFDTYLSLECGCIKTHTLDTVLTTNHFIDSIHISIHDVNPSTSAKENIKLYK